MNHITPIVKFFKSFLDIGVDGNQEPNHRMIIQVVNLIFVLGIISASVDSISRFLMGFRELSNYFTTTNFFFLCVLGLYFNYKKKFDLSTGFATAGIATLLFFNIHYFELYNSKAELVFFPLAVTAPLAFRNKRLGIIVFIYIALLMAELLWTMDNLANFTLIFNVLLIASGMVISTGSIIRHLTNSAKELKISNKQLQKQNIEQEELIIQNNLKTELLGILAHDLKGPASSFNLLSKKVAFLLRKENYSELEKLGDYFELAGDKIYHDIDRLLNWTIAQKENIIIRDIECSPFYLIEKITESLDFQFKNRNKTVVFENNLPKNIALTTDNHILEIIVKNLINNAAHHIEDGGCVAITGSVSNNTFAICIYNSGEPIDDSTVEQAKAGRYRKSKDGHGLGLGICFSLIQFIDGNLSFDTKSKSGTIAIVELPLK